jgi:hypothetical protein
MMKVDNLENKISNLLSVFSDKLCLRKQEIAKHY